MKENKRTDSIWSLKKISQFFGILAVFFFILAFANISFAQGLPSSQPAPALNCSITANCLEVRQLHKETQRQIKRFIDNDFVRHQNWMKTTFWERYLLPALMEMTSQISTTQSATIAQKSSIADGQIAGETINAGREIIFEAETRYNVDEETGLCTSISTTSDLNASSADADVAAESISESIVASSINRTGTANTPISYTNQQIALICERANPNNSALTAMCEDYERNNDSVSFNEILNQASIRVNHGGEATPEQTALVSGVRAMFNERGPLPNVSSETIKTVMPSVVAIRSPLAQSNLASKCYVGTLSDNFVDAETDMSPEMIAHLESQGLTEDQIKDFGASPNAQMQNANLRFLSPDFSIGLVKNEANVIRENLVVQSLQNTVEFNILEQQHCSELMSALALSKTLQNSIRGLSGRIATLGTQ